MYAGEFESVRRALVEREKEREVHDVTYQDQACIGPTRAFMVG